MIEISAMFLGVAAAFIAVMGLCIIRGILGPTAPDRLLALDTINTLVVGCMIVLGVAFGEIIYIDVAIVYALLSFVGTLYMANYLEVGI